MVDSLVHEKNGKLNEMTCHHKLEQYLNAYIAAAGIAQRMAGHSNGKNMGLYDRRNGDISVGRVERIGI